MKSLREQLAQLKAFESLERITLSTNPKSPSQSNAPRIDIHLKDMYGSVVKLCMGIYRCPVGHPIFVRMEGNSSKLLPLSHLSVYDGAIRVRNISSLVATLHTSLPLLHPMFVHSSSDFRF